MAADSGPGYSETLLSRREVVVFGLASLLAPVALRSAAIPDGASLPAASQRAAMFHKIVYDERDAYSRAFGLEALALGGAAEPVRDLTSLWLDELAPMWRENDFAVAGMTRPDVLFCLEQMAWPLGRRVVFRVDHHESASHEFEHRTTGPQSWIDPGSLGRDWPRELARALLRGPGSGPVRSASNSMVTAATLHRNTLISWVIAGRDARSTRGSAG
jgi:hypothetical protein